MKNKKLKENINKIKDLFQSNNYEAGFELLKTLNEPKLNENLADLILSKVENEYLPSFGKSSNAEEGFNILYLLIPDVVKLEVKSCATVKENKKHPSSAMGRVNLAWNKKRRDYYEQKRLIKWYYPSSQINFQG